MAAGVALPRVRRGEIWEADLDPVRGSEQGGVRPVLILQNDVGNQFSPATIVAAITSAPPRAYPFQVRLPAGAGGLTRQSVVKLEHVRTVSLERLIRYRGALTTAQMEEVDRALHYSFGLSCIL